jgi:hypothetical protein
MKALAILLLIGIAYAIPSCDNHQYHDFVWESSYSLPPRPADSLTTSCPVDPAICSANLSIEQKRQLILDGMVKNSSFPDFQTANSWNQNLTFTKYAPDGVPTTSTTNIRGAWNKIVAIQPSVISANNTLLVNSTGQVLSKHGFTFVIQHETFPSDCNTVYAICGYDYAVNDAFTPSLSTSTLSISTQYLIHHYHWVTHCYTSNGVTHCYTTCDYVGTDDRRDSLTIGDQIPSIAPPGQAFGFAFVDSRSKGIADAWLMLIFTKESNFAKFAWSNSTISLKESAYRLSYNLTPYDVITPQANQTPNDFEFYGLAILSRESKTLSGANLSAYLNGSIIASKLAQAGITLQNSAIYRYEKLHIIVPTNSLNCSLDFYSHFAHTRADICYFSNETPTIALNLSNRTNTTITIQLHFFDNQTNSSYANKQILLTYTNQTINLTTDQDGNAETTFNYSKNSPFVFAEFKTDLETKSEKATLPIPAEAPFGWDYLFYLLAVLLILFLLYKFTKKVMGFENS